MMKTIILMIFSCAIAVQNAAAAEKGWCAALDPADILAIRKEAEGLRAPAPRAIEHVHTEGTLPHRDLWDQSLEAEKDWPLMRDLAILWQAHHNQSDLETLSQLLTAWAKVYKPDFNPIDETNLDAYMEAYLMARHDLPAETQQVAHEFIARLGTGYSDGKGPGLASGDTRAVNNWFAHRVKLMTFAAVALNDKSMLTEARRQFQAHLSRNIRADGRTEDFEQRDALYYVIYDLEELVRAVAMARYGGQDWLPLRGTSDAGLEDALNWMIPYVTGQKQHEEFAHSRVMFDYQRRDAGVKGFSGLFDPNAAARLFAMAAHLDHRYKPITMRLVLPSGRAWMAHCL